MHEDMEKVPQRNCLSGDQPRRQNKTYTLKLYPSSGDPQLVIGGLYGAKTNVNCTVLGYAARIWGLESSDPTFQQKMAVILCFYKTSALLYAAN